MLVGGGGGVGEEKKAGRGGGGGGEGGGRGGVCFSSGATLQSEVDVEKPGNGKTVQRGFNEPQLPKPGARFSPGSGQFGSDQRLGWINIGPAQNNKAPNYPSCCLFGFLRGEKGGAQGCLFWQKCGKTVIKIWRRSVVSSTCAGDGDRPPLKLNRDTEKSRNIHHREEDEHVLNQS